MKKKIMFSNLICAILMSACTSVGHGSGNLPPQSQVVSETTTMKTGDKTETCIAKEDIKKIKVLYAGDSGIVMGPHIIASPFNYESKGAEVHIWCQQMLDALNSQPDISVRHMTPWEAFAKFPETPEELAQYDVVVLSDIEAEVLVLYPWVRFMDAPMGPNRLVTIRDYVKNGGSLLMSGGWSSFTGRRAIGGYHGTPVEEALPVECLPVSDDRREAPEGVHASPLDVSHPIMTNLPWETCPVFTGYNRLKVKPGSKILAEVRETGDPLIVVGNYGKGKSMAFASADSPHWGVGFMKWEGYNQFWIQAIRWLAAD